MNISQQDIADHLKLSRATISRSLNHAPGIDPATRETVLRAASKLGYRLPSQRRANGATLKGEFRTVGVLVCNPSGMEFGHGLYADTGAAMLAGIGQVLGENVALDVRYIDPSDAPNLMQPESQPPALRDGIWVGALLIYPFPPEVVAYLARRMACVSLVDHYANVDLDCVDADQSDAICKLVQHLHEQGHQRIGFASDAYKVRPSWVYTRFAAYFQMLHRLGLTYRSEDTINVGTGPTLNHEACAAAVVEGLERGVTAWVCAADHQAYELMGRLQSQGIRVPEDVSLTGFDGIPAPPGMKAVTTAMAPYREIGAAALRRLLFRLEQRTASTRHILSRCRILVQQTTAPPGGN